MNIFDPVKGETPQKNECRAGRPGQSRINNDDRYV